MRTAEIELDAVGTGILDLGQDASSSSIPRKEPSAIPPWPDPASRV